MNWKQIADEAGIVLDGRIAGLQLHQERHCAGAHLARDVIMCRAADVDKRIAAQAASSREPTAERIYMARALSADPYVGSAMIVRGVMSRWIVARGWNASYDMHETMALRAIDPFLRAAGVQLHPIERSARQIMPEAIVAPVRHRDAGDAASKALGQFAKQVDGRTVVVFSQGPDVCGIAA